MKTNLKSHFYETTYEGAPAKRINAEQELRRSLMACLLWENNFYEEGESIAKRIASLVSEVKPATVASMAIEAREKMKLRHAPLWVIREMAKLTNHKAFVANTLERVIQRSDELAEFLSLYWLDGRQPLSGQVKKGLARAFQKFNAYQLAKYNRDEAIKLRDVLFLCHAKPKDAEQEILWKQLIGGTLPIPDTWEVALSTGKNKKETWERLIVENKLGALALLRNLRNMAEVGVDENIIFDGLSDMKTEKVLPFRFISAARFVPQWERQLELAMFKCLEGHKKLPGKTVLLIDVSGSMDNAISSKSDLKRYDAANGLAILARELCDDVSIYSFSMSLKQIPARRGFALRDAIATSQEHGGTPLGLAIKSIYAPKTFVENTTNFGYGYGNQSTNFQGQAQYPNRLIVLTDEQSSDPVPNPVTGKGYMINVASNKNGVGYGAWNHIDGWSEAVFDYIQELESNNLE